MMEIGFNKSSFTSKFSDKNKHHKLRAFPARNNCSISLNLATIVARRNKPRNRSNSKCL